MMQIWQMIRKRWLLVVFIPLLAAVVSAGISCFYLKPVYEARTTLIVGKKVAAANQTAGQVLDYNVLLANQQLAKTYAAIAKSRTVENNVIKSLALPLSSETVDGYITVAPVKNTEILAITVRNPNPLLAAAIANAMAQEFSQAVIAIKKVDSVSIVDKAVIPEAPVSPNKKLNILIAFAVGLMAAAGWTFLLEFLDNKIKTTGDVEEVLAIPVLGLIPRYAVDQQVVHIKSATTTRMMKQKSLVKNTTYNFIYTGMNILFPLITAPYVSRILGASNLGKVNFATVVVNWFILFAVFGTTTYGVRAVARVRDDQEQLDRIFSEIFIINAILSLIVTAVYLVAVFNIEKFYVDWTLYLIMGLSIVLNMFAIDWFYRGIEEYRFITVRSAIFKLISLISIFLFVKQAGHYVIYGLISVMAISLSGILNYIYSRKFVRLKFKNVNPFVHFRSLSVFFFHTFVVNIYTNLDQVLIGFIIDTKAVAFMNRSVTIASLAVALSAAISNATLPRASYYKQNFEKKFRELMAEVPNYILWITIPMTVGIIVLAPNIMYILGGTEFLAAGSLLQVIALTIVFSPLSTYLQYQVLVASGKELFGLYCAIITSVLSLTLNIILIPTIGLLGACMVQVVAEFSAVSMRYYVAKNILHYQEIRFINKSSLTCFLAALIMGLAVMLIRMLISNLFISFAVGLAAGGVTYFVILVIAREKVTMFILHKLNIRFLG
ncbi:MAG TPA: oligosaccharide flippase family protein [Desulfitobacteriaceae bacterium]|nr:oligosaccharide flippase family protein [Desulfitobacteriaceae bacterium]